VKALASLCIFAAAVGFASVVQAGSRVAVMIGNDAGERGEARLRYAETDARRIADVFATVGGIAPPDVILLAGRRADAIRAALAEAESRLVGSTDGMLVVYYSGHADAEALHTDGTLLPLRDVQALLKTSGIATRLLIIDACRSGTITNTKGGIANGRFDIAGVIEPPPRGMVIIASAAASEDAQESDELRASFFTHHLASGLLGAADANHDGAVTLTEAFAYSAQHTTASTAATWAGAQHPSYRIDLQGRDDLVLTRPGAVASGATLGHLRLTEPGSYAVRRAEEPGLTAEVADDAVDRPLALRPGRYEVIRRAPDHLLVGTFQVWAAASTGVTADKMRRVEFGRAVRKGGTSSTSAFSLYAAGGLRGPLLGLGVAAGAGVGTRMDLRRFSTTVAADFGTGSIEGVRGTRLETRELCLRAGFYRSFDVSRLMVAAGAELGVSRFSQSASEQQLAGSSYAPHAGPSLLIELPIYRRVFVSLQGGVPAYLLNVESDDRTTTTRSIRVTYRLFAGAGGFL